MGFISSGSISMRSNLRLLRKRSFLRNNLYKIKGSIISRHKKRLKYQSLFDKLALLILHKMGYKEIV